MDDADYEFVRIPEFDMKELDLFETTFQCGKKRAADEGVDNGVRREKKAKMTGPVKIGECSWKRLDFVGLRIGNPRSAADAVCISTGREAAAKYWQSLIDAGRGLGRGIEEMKEEAVFPRPYHLRSFKVKVKASTTPMESIAFAASMRAKVNLIADVQPALSIEDAQFKCIHCDKTFKTKTALGQHIEAKHEEQ